MKTSKKTGRYYKANFINLYSHAYNIEPSFTTKLSYRDSFIEHYQIEDYIDKLRQTFYQLAKFRFLDDFSQR